MNVLTIVKELETIENSLRNQDILTSDKEIKYQIFLARKSVHNAICSLLEDKEDAPEQGRKKA
ncbi:MAG: hypothetical protein ACKPE3_02260 [Sphaerospermopsis kisseleviana]